jgi:excisionase family DNA binding protein
LRKAGIHCPLRYKDFIKGEFMPGPSVKNIEELPAILTVQQLRDFLGLSRPKSYELVHTNGFPMVRFGRVIRIPKEGLLRWMHEQHAHSSEQ